MRTQVTE